MPFAGDGAHTLPRNFVTDSVNAVPFGPDKFMEMFNDVSACLTIVRQAGLSTSSTAEVNALITTAIDGLKAGVSSSFDTLAEAATKFGSIDTLIAALQAADAVQAANIATETARATAAEATIAGDVAVLDARVDAFTALSQATGALFETLAALNANLNFSANAQAWVLGDATAANNGVYRKVGASGTGSWTRAGDLPYAVIGLSGVGGTANAITATSVLPPPTADRAAIFLLTPASSNTGSVTLAINGGSALAVKGQLGDDMAIGYLQAGATVALVQVGSTYRALVDFRTDSLAVMSAGQATPASGTAWSAALTISPDDLVFPRAGYLKEFRCYATNAGVLTVHVGRRFVSGSTKGQVYRSISYDVAAGAVTVYPDLWGEAGDYVFYSHTGIPHYGAASSSDAGVGYVTGPVTTDAAGTALTLNGALIMQAGATFEGATIGGARVANEAIASADLINAAFALGYESASTSIKETTATGDHRFYASFTPVAGTRYEIEVVHRDDGRNLKLYSAAGWVIDADITSAIAAIAAGSGAGASISPVYSCERIGAGWMRSKVIATAASATGTNIQVRLVNSAAATSYAGDAALGADIRSVALRVEGTTGTLLNDKLSASTWTKNNITVTDVAATSDIVKGPVTLDRLALIVGDVTRWNGKKIAGLGSSITSQNSWLSRLGAMLGMTVTNLGVSGGSLGMSSVAHPGSLAIYNQIASIPSDAALVILECGINDFGAGVVPLGAAGDTTTATFYGALHAAVAAIYAQAPSCVLALTTPHSASSAFASNNHITVRGDGAKLVDFQEAIDWASRKYGVALLDYGRQSGLNYWTAGTYTTDGLHPNATGGAVMASFFLQRIVQLAPRV